MHFHVAEQILAAIAAVDSLFTGVKMHLDLDFNWAILAFKYALIFSADP